MCERTLSQPVKGASCFLHGIRDINRTLALSIITALKWRDSYRCKNHCHFIKNVPERVDILKLYFSYSTYIVTFMFILTLAFSRKVFFFFSELPYNDYFEYFGPDFKLHISPSNMTNQNTLEYMDKIK